MSPESALQRESVNLGPSPNGGNDFPGDFGSLEDRAVTVRDRDSTEQVRVPIADLVSELRRRTGEE